MNTKLLLIALTTLALACWGITAPPVQQAETKEAVKDAPITAEDRTFLLNELKKTRQLLIEALAGVSAEQAKFKPAPERWSVLECAEHIALTEPFLLAYIREQVLKGEPKAPKAGPTNQQMVAMITDRSKPAKAPKEIAPTGKFASTAEALEAFKTNREATAKYVETTQDPLRMRSTQQFDAYQYLLLIASHTERHVKQINEVKAHADYPKK